MRVVDEAGAAGVVFDGLLDGVFLLLGEVEVSQGLLELLHLAVTAEALAAEAARGGGGDLAIAGWAGPAGLADCDAAGLASWVGWSDRSQNL